MSYAYFVMCMPLHVSVCIVVHLSVMLCVMCGMCAWYIMCVLCVSEGIVYVLTCATHTHSDLSEVGGASGAAFTELW